MNGIEIQYLLGIYFIVSSLSFTNNTFTADAVKLVAGILLLVLAIAGITGIR